MKYEKDLDFAVIKRNRKIDVDLIGVFSSAFRLNKKLFGRVPRKFEIIICDTNAEYKKQAKYYYSDRGTATVLRNNNLITKSPELIEKIGKWKRSDFRSIADHEMNHVFWNVFYKKLTKPCWLLEGFACYAGKNFVLTKRELRKLVEKYDVDFSLIEYRYLERSFKDGHYPRYPLWAEYTRFIAKRFGEKKLVEFMDLYVKNPTLVNYKKSFEKVFGVGNGVLFGEFLGLVGIN